MEAQERTRNTTPALVAMGGTPMAIVPKNIDEAFRLATAICRAQMAPRSFDNSPEKVMVAILHGAELGMTPMASLQSIAVVNGMPSMWGDGLLGIVRASGLLKKMDEEIEGDSDQMVATCRVYRRDTDEMIERTFSMGDAKFAGLLEKKGPWQQYPKRMMQMRARAFALRDGFADVLRGMHVREEVEDYVDLSKQDDGSYGNAAPPAPKRSDFTDKPAATVQLLPVFDPFGDHVGDFGPKGIAGQIETMAAKAKPNDVLSLIEHNKDAINTLLPDQKNFLLSLGHDAQAAIEKANIDRDGRYYEAEQKQKAELAAAKQRKADAVDSETGEVADAPVQDIPAEDEPDDPEPERDAAPDAPDSKPEPTVDDRADNIIGNLVKLANQPDDLGAYWQDVSDYLKKMEATGPDGVEAAKRVRTKHQQLTSGTLAV